MARISFRQGIVRHQTDTNSNPTFLQKVGDYINLIVSPDPTIITFVCGPKDYLYTEHLTQTNAWGPFTPGNDVWLFWELNVMTGIRTFGSTTLEPVETATAPVSPVVGQMWFNTSTKQWFEWNSASWTHVIRVFAAKLANSTQLVSMSIKAPEFIGTQVGLTTETSAGALVFDTTGKPIFDSTHKFFTTEDIFITGVPTGASLRINNIVLRAQAQQPIGAFNVVVYSDYNKIVPAIPFSTLNRIYGITEEGANVNDVVSVITEGIIFNETWDWEAAGANVNDPVYIDNTGQIVLAPIGVADALPVGAVVGPQSILFDPTLYGLSNGTSSLDDTIIGDIDFIKDALLSPTVNPDFKFNSLDQSTYVGLRSSTIIPNSFTIQLPDAEPTHEGQVLSVVTLGAGLYQAQFRDNAYDVTMSQSGVINNGDIVGRHVSGRPITLEETPIDNSLHVGFCEVAPPVSPAVFTIYRTSTATITSPPTAIGTITFSPGSNDALVVFNSTVIVPKDHIYIEADSTNGIEGVHFNLVGFTIIN